MRRKIVLRFTCLSVLLLINLKVWATTYTYDGSGDPGLLTNWTGSPANFATSGDVFVFPTGTTASFATAITINSITFQLNGTANVTFGSNISGGSAFIYVGDGTGTAATATVPTTVTISGVTFGVLKNSTLYYGSTSTFYTRNTTAPVNDATSTIIFNGTSAQNIGQYTYVFGNVIFNNTAGVSETVSGGIYTFAGNVTLKTGTFTSKSSNTIKGNVIWDGTTNNGTWNTSANTINFTGTAAQSYPAQAFNNGGSGYIGSLSINNAAGVTISSGTSVIRNVLTLTSGVLALASGTTLQLGTPTTAGSVSGTPSSTNQVDAVNGSIILAGNAAQTIPASFFKTNTINSLTLSNQGADVTMTTPITVNGALTFTNGFLVSSSTNLLTIGSAATISGASATSFVKGPVTFNTNSTNAYIFPIGKGTTYKPLTLTPGAATAGSFQAEYFAADAGTAVVSPVNARLNNEYWSTSNPGGTTAALTFNWGDSYTGTAGNWSNSTNPTASNYLTVVQLAGGNWAKATTATLAGDASSGTLATAQISTFGTFTYGYGSLAAGDVFYFMPSSGDANALANWNTKPDGSGSAPADLTTSGSRFYIINGGKSATLSGAFGAGQVYIYVGDETGGSLGTGTTGTLTTTTSANNLRATISVNKNSVFHYRMPPTGATYYPVLNYMDASSTVVYDGTVAQNVLAGNYGNLTINNASGAALVNNIGISGTIAATSGTLKTQTKAITFNGGALQTIPGNTVYNGSNADQIVINNEAGVKLADSSTLTVLDSLIVNSGTFTLGVGSNVIVKGVTYVPPTPVVDSTYKAGYTMVWNDEFNGTSGAAPDANKWVHHYTSTTPTTVTYPYTYQRLSLASYSKLDGIGHLLIMANDSTNGIFYCGDIASAWPYKYMKQYGYMECRMKYTSNNGVVNAFWLQSPVVGNNPPADDPATYGTEIDVCEYLGPASAAPYGRVNTTIHKNGYAAPYHQQTTNATTVATGWHTVGVEWSPTACKFYTDGILKWTMSDTSFISKHPEMFIISTGFGWGVAPNQTGSTWPVAMQVDYVRVYNKN
jgi:hypothetical protein